MTEAADCVADLLPLGPLPAAMLQALEQSKGYAFRALVFKKLGESLQPGWSWKHPDPSNLPTYATGAGGTYLHATTQRSVRWRSNRALVQELTVEGLSGPGHQLDISLVRRFDPQFTNPVRWYSVGLSLECKNFGTTADPTKASMSVARDLIGLAIDLGCAALPGRRRIIAVIAHDMTDNAVEFIEAYGQDVLERTAPGESDAWVAWLVRRLKFGRALTKGQQ